MKILFYLVSSLILAAALCTVLLAVGVLKFKDEDVVAEINPITEKLFSRVTIGLDSVQKIKDVSSSAVGQKLSLASPEEQAVSTPPQSTVPGPDTQPASDRESLIHTRALVFLSERAGTGGADIEERFNKFLVQELNIEQKETEKFVRMCFWKNFVTLQHQWRPGESDQMQSAFKREKELKQAGFAARGLTLISGEVLESEARMQELKQYLSENALKGEKL